MNEVYDSGFDDLAMLGSVFGSRGSEKVREQDKQRGRRSVLARSDGRG